MTSLPLCLLLLLASGGLAAPVASPQSSVRVSFLSPPHGYSHTVESARSRMGRPRARQINLQRRNSVIPEGMTVAVVTALHPEPTAHPGYLISRPSTRLPRTFGLRRINQELSNDLQNPEAMWPMGVFLPPDHDLQAVHLSLKAIENQRLFEESEGDPDPFLRTGEDAAATVRYLFSLGELYFSDYPHVEVLIRYQGEREANGLAGNRLGSIRPESPFYRWPSKSSSAFEY